MLNPLLFYMIFEGNPALLNQTSLIAFTEGSETSSRMDRNDALRATGSDANALMFGRQHHPCRNSGPAEIVGQGRATQFLEYAGTDYRCREMWSERVGDATHTDMENVRPSTSTVSTKRPPATKWGGGKGDIEVIESTSCGKDLAQGWHGWEKAPGETI